jgi:Na+/H+-dicarboxylate symporter
MTLTVRVLIGLVAGFALGFGLAGISPAAALAVSDILTPVGTLFVNLIRMTAIPLVASMLIASLGATIAPGGLGRVTARALAVSVVLLTTASVASLLVAVPVLARLPIDRDAANALRSGVAADPATAAAAPGVAQWIVELVPQNVVRAAADGAILPVIVFAVLFGLALGRAPDERRLAVVRVADGVAEVMQRLVGWILQLAPIGVFALAVPLASRLGLSLAGAVLVYVGLVVALTAAAIAMILYPLGLVAGRMPPRRFVEYCAPAQAIAFASRSSLASLPAAIASAEHAGIPPGLSRFVLPLAVSVFHFGAAIAQTVGVVFLANLFGATLSGPALATIVVAVVLASFAVPSIPGGSIIALVPVLSAAGLPLDGVAILLALDAVPDMFRTTANLTGAMTLVAVLPGPRDPRYSDAVAGTI